VRLEKLLHIPSSGGATYEDGRVLKPLIHVSDILDIVLDAPPPNLVLSLAFPVPAKAEGVYLVALGCKAVHKPLIPVPSCMPKAMYKQDLGVLALYGGFLGNDLQMHCCSSLKIWVGASAPTSAIPNPSLRAIEAPWMECIYSESVCGDAPYEKPIRSFL
jgi:hypothetical protein